MHMALLYLDKQERYYDDSDMNHVKHSGQEIISWMRENQLKRLGLMDNS